MPVLPVSADWKILPPLPDPVGFGGMFAGASEGALVAGGGSRFIDKPAWNGGTKVFSDKVFVLRSLEGPWQELPTRLPSPVAHAASAAFGGEILLAGGVNEHGAVKSVLRISLRQGVLQIVSLPDLPHPIVYGAAAIVKDVLYVIGGVNDPASTEPSQQCWTLPLISEAGRPYVWTRVPDLPGKPGIVMTAGSDGKDLYVFGGMHYLPSEEGKSRPVPLDNAWRYDPAAKTWTALEDMPFARVAAATPAPQIPDGGFLIAGGYGFVHPGLAKDHPGFERETLVYSPAGNSWKAGPLLPCERHIDPDLPTSPGPEPAAAAACAVWQGMAVLISGEVRPATRTPAVVGLPLDGLND